MHHFQWANPLVNCGYPLAMYMFIEKVDFPIENGGSFHSYASLPEGN